MGNITESIMLLTVLTSCSFSRVTEILRSNKLHQELPVYKSSYDLLVEIFRFTKEFSKEYKYTVGESLKRETIELLTLIFQANSKTDKHATLQDARERIEVIRLFIRLNKVQTVKAKDL